MATFFFMHLRETILDEHSKANCNKIVNWVGDSQKRFDELFNLFLNSEYRVNQRAACIPTRSSRLVQDSVIPIQITYCFR